MRANPHINYRNYIKASEAPLPEYDLLNFNYQNIKQGIDLGIKDVKALLETGDHNFGAAVKQDLIL